MQYMNPICLFVNYVLETADIDGVIAHCMMTQTLYNNVLLNLNDTNLL